MDLSEYPHVLVNGARPVFRVAGTLLRAWLNVFWLKPKRDTLLFCRRKLLFPFSGYTASCQVLRLLVSSLTWLYKLPPVLNSETSRVESVPSRLENLESSIPCQLMCFQHQGSLTSPKGVR